MENIICGCGKTFAKKLVEDRYDLAKIEQNALKMCDDCHTDYECEKITNYEQYNGII